MEIIVQAEAIRGPIWISVALFVLALMVDLFFGRLIYSRLKSEGLSAVVFGFLLICLIFTSWSFLEGYSYANTQDLQIRLNEKVLNLSTGPAEIPLSKLTAKIDQVTDMNADIVTEQHVGRGLIIEVPQLDQYLHLNFTDTRSTVFKIKDRIQLLIGKQISEQEALAFVSFIEANKK